MMSLLRTSAMSQAFGQRSGTVRNLCTGCLRRLEELGSLFWWLYDYMLGLFVCLSVCQLMTTVVFCFYCASSQSTVWYHCLSCINTLMSYVLYSHIWKAPRVKFGLQATFFSFSIILSVLPCCLSLLSSDFSLSKWNGGWHSFFSSSPSHTLFLPSFSLLLFYSLCSLVEKSQKDQKDPGEPFCLTNYLKKEHSLSRLGHNHLTALLEHSLKKP